jgi:hypothetical protein
MTSPQGQGSILGMKHLVACWLHGVCKIKKGQPGAPEAVLEPSRLEGQHDESEVRGKMLHDRGKAMNIWLIRRGRDLRRSVMFC